MSVRCFRYATQIKLPTSVPLLASFYISVRFTSRFMYAMQKTRRLLTIIVIADRSLTALTRRTVVIVVSRSRRSHFQRSRRVPCSPNFQGRVLDARYRIEHSDSDTNNFRIISTLICRESSITVRYSVSVSVIKEREERYCDHAGRLAGKH